MNWEFVIRFLKAIEKKHEGFFIANKLRILDCVDISGTRIVNIQIYKNKLSREIVKDIESILEFLNINITVIIPKQ